MSTGLVYLRPMTVAYARRTGPHGTSSLEAWAHMLGWLDQQGYRAMVPRGFGLIHKAAALRDQTDPVYDACVELVDPVTVDLEAGIDRGHLKGGAFLLQRHSGPVELIGEAFRKLRTEEATRRGLKCDENRPMIEIYLDDPYRSPAPHRLDLCVPVQVG
ncbi:MAG TPA: GyrI-like domain-containing protein [Hyphomicrobiaceae bacterium]|nr:GyrI-like domain-containing protein [Hyphomicrobiaceae bacterium]